MRGVDNGTVVRRIVINGKVICLGGGSSGNGWSSSSRDCRFASG